MEFPYTTGNLYPLNVKKVLDEIKGEKSFILLETGMVTDDNRTSYLFKRPKRIIKAHGPGDVDYVYSEMERHLSKGRYLAGWFSYEWGLCLEPKLKPLLKGYNKDIPLVWLGVFDTPRIWRHDENSSSFFSLPEQPVFVDQLKFFVDKPSYFKTIKKIKDYIAMGDTYQVNYTMPVSFRLKGSHADLYLLLRSRQAVSYSAFIKDGNLSVLSLSPELFFLRDGAFIKSMPMKGTISRGKNLKEDIRLARRLKEDNKNRAENVMIVDLIRNDLGRCSETGSVHVPKLFTIERYETLFQMTSTVEGRLRSGILWKDIFRSIFPCGSVTGTPKIRTMEIISELEAHPRDVYTGAIGFIGPDNQAAFNVAIRTVTLDKDQGIINVGSGITIDSDPDEEYEECILKGKFFLTKRDKAQGLCFDFSLIETICWDKSAGYHLLERHLKRLADSAHYFSFRLDIEALKRRLTDLAQKLLQEGKRKRVRLLLSRNGKISLSDSLITPVSIHLFSVSQDRVSSQDIFLFHKTTLRPLYDKYRKEADKAGLFDIIFMNERDEITEGSISNIFILSEGVLWTPPVECGLLDGTLRQELVEKGEARERIIFSHDLKKAEKIFLGNSVRGLVEVRPAF